MSPLFFPKPIKPDRVRDLLARFVPPKPALIKAA